MIIVLIGYMGSGKSTIGKRLATTLNYSFLDLDDYISNKEKNSISEVFKTKGEIYFRKKETEYLSEIINTSEKLVLALGGGTPCYGKNLELIMGVPNIISFYLKLSIQQLTQRLLLERENRPIISHLKSEDELLEFIGKHLFERIQYYSQAEFTLITDDKTPKEIIEDFLVHLI